MGEGGIRDLPAPKAPAPSANLADAGSAPGRDWAPGHDGASEDTPGEKSAEGRRTGCSGRREGFHTGAEVSDLEKGSLGRGCAGRRKRPGKGIPDRWNGMCKGPRRECDSSSEDGEGRGGGAVRRGGGSREVRGRETPRTDPMSFLESSGAVGRRAVGEVGTEKPVLRVNQKRERKGQ